MFILKHYCILPEVEEYNPHLIPYSVISLLIISSISNMVSQVISLLHIFQLEFCMYIYAHESHVGYST
jgi:hypothetical protein